MSTRHLVADRNRTLGRDVDFNHLQHATAKLVATLHAVNRTVTIVDRFFDLRPVLFVQRFDIFDACFAFELARYR